MSGLPQDSPPAAENQAPTKRRGYTITKPDDVRAIRQGYARAKAAPWGHRGRIIAALGDQYHLTPRQIENIGRGRSRCRVA